MEKVLVIGIGRDDIRNHLECLPSVILAKKLDKVVELVQRCHLGGPTLLVVTLEYFPQVDGLRAPSHVDLAQVSSKDVVG